MNRDKEQLFLNSKISARDQKELRIQNSKRETSEQKSDFKTYTKRGFFFFLLVMYGY